MNKYRKYCYIVCFIASFLISMISNPLISFAWGDSTYLETGVAGSHRQFYTLDDINSGKLGNIVTFNSITDAAQTGNELNFVSAVCNAHNRFS